MIITDKDYKRWSNMSKVICNNREIAEEILQELLLNMIENGRTNPDKLNDCYIFMSLKNRFLNYIKKEKNRKTDDYIVELDPGFNDGSNWTIGLERLEDTSSPEDIQELIKKNLEDQDKINIITETILELESYDKKLYQLHFIWGLSQRQIAKKIGISHMTINMRVNKIKDKIKERYEQGR